MIRRALLGLAHARVHHRVQVARRERPPAQELPDGLFHGQRRPPRRQHQVCQADFPILSDPTKQVAKAYGVLNDRGMANRSFYIGKDGKILAIDKAVKPETSAQDMAAKLKELGVPTT